MTFYVFNLLNSAGESLFFLSIIPCQLMYWNEWIYWKDFIWRIQNGIFNYFKPHWVALLCDTPAVEGGEDSQRIIMLLWLLLLLLAWPSNKIAQCRCSSEPYCARPPCRPSGRAPSRRPRSGGGGRRSCSRAGWAAASRPPRPAPPSCRTGGDTLPAELGRSFVWRQVAACSGKVFLRHPTGSWLGWAGSSFLLA